MDQKKSFGLIIPSKKQAFRPKVNAIFGSDSDDEPPKKKPSIPQSKKPLPKPIKEEVTEDPSIYEYDNIYDEMKSQQAAAIAPKTSKPSRYIDTLLKAADKRKKGQERRVERQVQVEREKEGDKFSDKETFVTAGYRKKIQEREEEEERERRENAINDMMDVTKQKDLSGFYRHFLKQSVGEEKIPTFGEKDTKIKEEVLSDPEPQSAIPDENIDRDTDLSESSDSDESDKEVKKSGSQDSVATDTRKENRAKFSSRKRKVQSSNIRKPIERDGSRSPRNRSSSRESHTDEKETTRTSHKSSAREKGDSDSENERDSTDEENGRSRQIKERSHETTSQLEDGRDANEKENVTPEAKKINMFEKRNVGTKFAEAQARYFQRLAALSN